MKQIRNSEVAMQIRRLNRRMAYFGIIFLLCAGCELVVDIDVPREPVKIVMNGIANTEEVWTVSLSNSKYILEQPGHYTPIEDGSINITKDDGSVFPLEYTTLGYYTIEQKPEPGRTYKVTASAPDRATVTSTVHVPPMPNIVGMEWDSAKAEMVNGSGSMRIPLYVTFKDAPDVSNYYQLQAFTSYAVKRTMQDGTVREDSVRTNMIVERPKEGFEESDDYIFRFRDLNFDGQTYTLPVRIDFIPFYQFYRIDIVLSEISHDYYRYIQESDLQFESDGNPFAQPVKVNSNVENGFGLIGAQSSYTQSFKRKEESR